MQDQNFVGLSLGSIFRVEVVLSVISLFGTDDKLLLRNTEVFT